jgi:non-specific serine/threonine protein kinase
LLQYPHREFHAAELVALVSGAEATSQTATEAFQLALSVTHLGDAGEMLDPQAKAEYKQRLIDLRDELQEAETFNDVGRVERLRAEIDFLTQELTNAVGLGGRHRKAASQAERARVNVTRTLRAALGKIAESHPALGRYLSNTIRTGLYCSYVPDSNSSLIWEF